MATDDGITGIPNERPDTPGQERLPDETVEFAREYATFWCRKRQRPDLWSDVAAAAVVSACKPENIAVVRHYSRPNYGTDEFVLAEQKLRTLVCSAYDSVSGRKRKEYGQCTADGTVMDGREGLPGTDMAIVLDVREAVARLNDTEQVVVSCRSRGLTYDEIADGLGAVTGLEYNRDQIRGINERAEFKLRIYLRAYDPEKD